MHSTIIILNDSVKIGHGDSLKTRLAPNVPATPRRHSYTPREMDSRGVGDQATGNEGTSCVVLGPLQRQKGTCPLQAVP